jgi:predicted nucleotidyltransferase component of viral defense system
MVPGCLASSDLKTTLAFKRGTALKRCYFGDHRFSEDLDFTLIEPVSFADIQRRLEPMYHITRSTKTPESALHLTVRIVCNTLTAICST